MYRNSGVLELTALIVIVPIRQNDSRLRELFLMIFLNRKLIEMPASGEKQFVTCNMVLSIT